MNFSLEIGLKTDLSNLPKVKDVYITLLPGEDFKHVANKAKELAKIMVGESNSLINQHMSTIVDVFESGKEKGIEFWHAIIRQTYVKKIITKEIESYGSIKLTEKGKKFLEKPYSFTITEDHKYEQTKVSNNCVQKKSSLY